MNSWKVFVKERPLNIHICWIHERVGAICRYGLNLEGKKKTKLYLQVVRWGCYNRIPWTFVSHSSGLFEILKIQCLMKALLLVHRWPCCCVFHWQERRESSLRLGISSYKDTCPYKRSWGAPPLWPHNFSKPHVQVLLYWELGFNIWFEGHIFSL